MGLDVTSVVDAVGLEVASGTLVLSILDSWDWTDTPTHLLSLQEKLNAYFAFIESGQVFDHHPNVRGARIRIDVISKYPLHPDGSVLLDNARTVALELDVAVVHRVI
jgi:hypothetical protein